MAWIHNITRSAVDGALYSNIQSLDGASRMLPVHQIPRNLTRQQGKDGLKAILDSSRHSLDNVALYLDRLNWTAMSPLGQSLHRFDTTDGEIWMPSQLLVESMLCSLPKMNQLLFTPTPLAELCHPAPNTSGKRIELYKNEQTRWNTTPSTSERLAWLTHSISARRAWATTYRNALDGRIDCTMPGGSFEYKLRGTRLRGVFCVTAATLVNVSCSDIYTSEDFCHQTYQINSRVKRDSLKSQASRKTVEAIALDCPVVSEAQLARVREILYPTPPKNRRDVMPHFVNILKMQLRLAKIKLHTQCRWCDLPASREEVKSAYGRHSYMKSTGTWERVKAVLLEQH